jgi:tetratricopeptide (TPR) repeat protein
VGTLVQQLEKMISEVRWPSEHRTTMDCRRAYESGLDAVNMYRGDPNIFVEALKIFQSSRSCPYAYAGIAYTLAMAAASGKAKKYGLQRAMEWLEKSQKQEPDRPEINFIEVAIYLNQGQLENARLVLDHLSQQDPHNYFVCLAEVDYWRELRDDDQYHHWLRQAKTGATNRSRQAFVLNSLANFYFDKKLYAKSINVYQRVAEIDPQDPWLWHNMSVMYVRLDRFKEADQCNKRALSLMDFGAAREIEQVIKQNRGGLGRLFGL